MKCLMIIDMQKGLFTEDNPRFNSEEVIQNIKILSACFRSNSFPVFYIQHNGMYEDDFKPNTREWEILEEIFPLKEDIVIEKYSNDSFYNSKLEKKLQEMRVDELYITGCATDFCVNSTVQSAYFKGYNVTVVADSHTTGKRPKLSAEDVIDHYNWLWSELIPINKKAISVKKTNHIMNEMKYEN